MTSLAVEDTVDSGFVRIPAGWVQQGFSVDDIHELLYALPQGHRGDPDVLAQLAIEVAHARPPKLMPVAAFECARRVTSLADAQSALPDGWASERLGAYYESPAPHASFDTREDAERCATTLGMRLLTETEWEYIAREGGRIRFTNVPADRHPWRLADDDAIDYGRANGWGVHNLLGSGEWTSTDWAEGSVTRGGHAMFQDDLELIALHAAYRMRNTVDGAAMRLARDLPDAGEPGEAPPVASLFSTTLDALCDTPRRRKVALNALALACRAAPGDDTRGLVAELLEAIPALGKARAQILHAISLAMPEAPEALLADVTTALLPLLEDETEAVRTQAARVLALTDDPRASGACSARLEVEKKDKVRSSLVLALGALLGEDAMPTLRARWSAERGRWSRAALAIALVEAGEPLDESLVDALAAALALPEVKSGVYSWHDGSLRGPAEAALRSGAGDATERAIRSLMAQASRAGLTKPRGLTLWVSAMGLAVERESTRGLPGPLLRVVVEPLSAEDMPAEMLVFGKWGIPKSLTARRRWVGLDPPSALERVFTVDGETGTWREMLHRHSNLRKLGEAVGGATWLEASFRLAVGEYSPHPIWTIPLLTGALDYAREHDRDAAVAWVEAVISSYPVRERAWLLYAWLSLTERELPAAWEPWVSLSPRLDPRVCRRIAEGLAPERREAVLVAKLDELVAPFRDETLSSARPKNLSEYVRSNRHLLTACPSVEVLRRLLQVALVGLRWTTAVKSLEELVVDIPGGADLLAAFGAAVSTVSRRESAIAALDTF